MITEVGRILEMTHKAGLSHEKINKRRLCDYIGCTSEAYFNEVINNRECKVCFTHWRNKLTPSYSKPKEEESMRERLEGLINKYEMKLRLPVDNNTKSYYQGKITAYEHAIILLDLNKEAN
ncbi:hypothetical protein [Bacillus paranthracis]|uniref:hypothetical protein n=1 Tax=Bacillus paranthracis TaxID=2026186 RepID=UPI0013D3B6BA|nr:hypothetical protein [Bacillus paranthracis]